MAQGRTPDRVHVVRPPQDDMQPRENKGMELIRTLAQINDKLKRSEAERYELLAELREYRKSLTELEDKTEQTEKAYLSLENKLKSRDTVDSELSQRQARFERALKDTEGKLLQAAAGQALLDQKIKDNEDRQTTINQRLDDSVSLQAKLDRQIEKIGQDKSRMLRKVEKLEEILVETQDTLKARALVLLTDQSTAAQSANPQIPAWLGNNNDANAESSDMPWWRQSVRIQSVGMGAMIVAALLLGWAINQVQQPEIPQIAVLENGGMARLNLNEKKWETIPNQAPQTAPQESSALAPAPASAPQEDTLPVETPATSAASVVEETVAPSTPVTTPAAPAAAETDNVVNYSDDQLMAALNDDPEKLASQLNGIEPGVSLEPEQEQPIQNVPVNTAAVAAPSPQIDPAAFVQPTDLAAKIAADKGTGSLSERIKPDAALPPQIQKLEEQAFAGVGEAQHDLAAIYTAGRAGVTQNFQRSALWFREAADNGVSNARYNLGVLYHQGLGVNKDLDRALYWYREAAKLGHPEAEYNLGIAYIEGIGTGYNPKLAAAFFESAANQGVTEAAYNLGLIYENGLIGGKARVEDAMLWYKIAADNGNADAKAALEQLATAQQISQEDINKIVDRLQAINLSTKGRKAGPVGNAAPVSKWQSNRG